MKQGPQRQSQCGRHQALHARPARLPRKAPHTPAHRDRMSEHLDASIDFHTDIPRWLAYVYETHSIGRFAQVFPRYEINPSDCVACPFLRFDRYFTCPVTFGPIRAARVFILVKISAREKIARHWFVGLVVQATQRRAAVYVFLRERSWPIMGTPFVPA
ncbi:MULTISPECIES: hypothetical protein [Burkholderia]|uniref:hypothetical protein n=2 Tax=Burkholderiaceae TaxID=119060 RepID=UPI000F5921F4|nr:hypothetical protein [Burkholderia sp. AU31280]